MKPSSGAEQTRGLPMPHRSLKKIPSAIKLTAAHLCQYGTVDFEVAAGQMVLVRQVVQVIAEIACMVVRRRRANRPQLYGVLTAFRRWDLRWDPCLFVCLFVWFTVFR